MSAVGQIERATQNRVVKLLHEQLGYTYLGNWEERSDNSNIEEDYLRPFLEQQGNVSPDIGRVVLTALEKDPQHRFASVAAFTRSLEQACMPILAIQHSDLAFPSSLSKRQMDETLPPSIEHHSRHNPQPAALVQSFPVQQGSQQYQKPSVRMVLLLIIVVLLVIGGSGLIFYSKVFLPATFDAQTTATAQFDATIAAMTPQDIYTYATRGSPIIQDSLSDQSNSTWKNESHPVGNCNFSSGAYHVKVVVVSNFLACLSMNSNFRNFAFQVQMTIIKGDAGGIIFRIASGNSQFYYFYIYADGHYIFALGTSSALLSGENGSTSLLKAGYNQANLITVVAHGSEFYLYVNKQYVTHMSDSTLSAGAIGLFVRDDANAYTEVAFGNAQVWKL